MTKTTEKVENKRMELKNRVIGTNMQKKDRKSIKYKKILKHNNEKQKKYRQIKKENSKMVYTVNDIEKNEIIGRQYGVSRKSFINLHGIIK